MMRSFFVRYRWVTLVTTGVTGGPEGGERQVQPEWQPEQSEIVSITSSDIGMPVERAGPKRLYEAVMAKLAAQHGVEPDKLDIVAYTPVDNPAAPVYRK